MNLTDPSVFICALPSEARVVIDELGLRQTLERPFRCHQREAVMVVVSGIGCLASAAATGYVAALHPHAADAAWINFGIAGGHGHGIGASVIAARVRHATMAGNHYPGLAFACPLEAADIVSHDEPVAALPPNQVCDMEAFGFCRTVERIAGVDRLQVLKVISDNAERGLDQIDRGFVRDLCKQALPDLLELGEAMQAAARHARAPAVPVPTHLRLSSTQRRSIEAGLRRLAALEDGQADVAELFASCRNANEALDTLRKRISARSPRWPA